MQRTRAACSAYYPPARLKVALLALALSLLWSDRAVCRDYSVEVEVTSEEELRQLYYDGLIDDEEFQLLLRLLESPVDLNRAERADLSQLPGVTPTLAEALVEERVVNGPYFSLADAVARVAEMTWRNAAQMDVFVVTRHVKGRARPIKGHVDFLIAKELDAVREIEDDYPARSHSPAQLGYDKWPALALGVGATVLGWLDIGLAGTAQEGLKSAIYEPASRDIFASYGSPVFRPYMGYLRIVRPVGQVVVGSYHLHYGHGLVMSTLGGHERHGAYLRRTLGRTEDRIREFDGLFGAVGRLPTLRLGRVEFDLSTFASLRNYDQYISYVGLAGGERLDPGTTEVDTPRVWVDGQKASYVTLPSVFRAGMLGGNATLRVNRRTHIGFTGWAGFMDRTLMEGVTDQTTLFIRQRWPSSDAFGALGLNGGLGIGLFDLSGEWALWLEGEQPAQGLLFMGELEPAWGQFVLTLRHYDVGFANPMSRGQSAPDRSAGHSDRNEQGLRFSTTIRPNKFIRATTRLDLARNIEADVTDLDLRASVVGRPLDWLQLRVFTRYANQNLAVSGREHTYGGTLDAELFGLFGQLEDESLEISVDRAGERVTLGGSVRFQEKKVGSITLRYKRDWVDSGKTVEVPGGYCETRMQQGHSARMLGRLRIHRSSTLSGGFGYVDDDVQGDRGLSAVPGPHGFVGYLQLEQKILDRVKFVVRGKVGRRLPDAPSACDEGDLLPASVVTYQPDDYELRHFGSLLFTTRVKF